VSNPIVINSKPMPDEIKPFSGLFPANEEIIVSPKHPEQNIRMIQMKEQDVPGVRRIISV